MWCLEVFRYVRPANREQKYCFVSLGYIDKIFETKNEAIQYYDEHNSHMRSLDAHETLMSDWDPNTHRAYAVRRYCRQLMDIKPF